jgi:rhodanese-related sulfurtransferase
MFLFRPFALLLGSLLLCGVAFATDAPQEYQYISASDLEARLNANQPTHIVDIQVEEEFDRHHVKGAEPTHAYPVQSDADKAKLGTLVNRLQADSDPVVIVCPRGAGGARRTYDYLRDRGIAAERLLILEKGQEGWTCAPLTEGK